MKSLFVAFCFVGAAFAQSVSVVTPGGGTPTISGMAYSLTCSFSSITTARTLEYVVNEETVAVVQTWEGNRCPAYSWNTNDIANGNHLIRAIARDATNAVLATSSDVTFVVDNNVELNDGSGTVDATLSVATGTALGSAWSGFVNVTPTLGGTHGTAVIALNVDGKSVSVDLSTGTDYPFNTTVFADGTHLLSMSVTQGIMGGQTQLIASWQRKVTITNGTAYPQELRTNGSEQFVAPGAMGTQITATVYNTDGTTTASTPQCYSLDTSIVTVSGCVPTGVAHGVGRIIVLDPATTGTDLVRIGGNSFTSASANSGMGFAAWQVYQWIHISTNTGGWVAGTYQALSWGGGGCSVTGGCSLGLTTSSGASSGSYSMGPGTTVYVYVQSANTLPHFTRNGGYTTTYSATDSFFPASAFNSSQGGQFSYDNTQYMNDSLVAGWNTQEITGCLVGETPTQLGVGGWGSFYRCTGFSANESQWKTGIDDLVAHFKSICPLCYFKSVNTSWIANNGLFATTKGTGSTYTPPAWQYWMQAQGNTCTPSSTEKCYGASNGQENDDEVTSLFNNVPLPGGTLGSTDGPSQIVATSGNCVATYPSSRGIPGNSSNNLIIHGSVTSALNNAYPDTFTISSVTSSTITFSCPGVSDGTRNSGNDAALVVEPLAINGWRTMTDYVTYDAFAQLNTWNAAASPAAPLQTWSPAGLASSTALNNWAGDTRMSGYGDLYDPNNSGFAGTWLTHDLGFYSYLNQSIYRTNLTYAPADQRPWCALSSMNSTVFIFSGKNLTSSTFSGDTVTTSTAHGFTNAVPGITRAVASGQSTGGDNGNYHIRNFPTATTVQLVITPTPAADSNGATLHFSNGDSFTATLSAGTAPVFATFNCNITYVRDIGLTFTVTGGDNADWVGPTFWYSTESDPTCGNGFTAIYQVPAASSTGGTISIIPDNYVHRGYTAASAANGTAYDYSSAMVPILFGASCLRGYLMGQDTQLQDPVDKRWAGTTYAYNQYFNDYSHFAGNQWFQVGGNAKINFGGSTDIWYSAQMPNLMMHRWAKLMFQPRFASPDYGEGFLSTARGDGGTTYGNILVVHNFWDWTRTRTITLTPYELSSQAIWKEYCRPLVGCVLTQIASGTATDSVTFDPVSTVWYIFSKIGASEITRPTVGIRLADVTNATDLAVRYSCAPYPIRDQTSGVLVSVAAASGATVTLPADPALCAVNYQIQMLNSSGNVLANSGIQTIAQQ